MQISKLYPLRVVFLLAAALIGGTVAEVAFAVEAKVESITPSVFSLGETQTVKIVGEGLSSVRDIVFYDQGLKCLSIEADGDFAAKATIQVSKDAKVGSAPCRLLTNDGFSNLKTLRLTDLPLIFEPERQSPTDSASIDLDSEAYRTGVAIYGTLERGSYDRYTVEMNAGQSCTAVVDAVTLGGPLLDTVLKVYEPSGQLVAMVDDTSLFRQDPLLQFTAKEAGAHIIEVHESNYDGGEDNHYVLYLGDFPLPAVLYPPGGQVGEPLQVVSLPEGEAKSRSYSMPPLEGSADGWLEFRGQIDGETVSQRSPKAVRLRVSPFPNVLESEDNESAKAVLDQAQSLPAAFCGILDKPNDLDHFAFKAEAGETIRFESFAERVGSPIDTVITIMDAEGNRLVAGDDWMSHDSLLDFRPKESGVYVLQVADKLGNGFASGVYRVEAYFVQPSVTAFLPRPNRMSQAGQSIAVPQGNRVFAGIGVRRDLVSGDASLVFEDLPAGVTVPSWQIPADQFWMPVVLTAAKSAPLAGGLVNLRARVEPENDSTSQVVEGDFKQTVDLVSNSADRLFYGVNVDRIPVATVDPIPFQVDLLQPQTVLAIGGTLALKIKVTRDPGFDEPLVIKLPFLPPWVTCEPEVVVPAGVDEVAYPIIAHRKAEPRSWPLVATAEVDARKASADVTTLRGRQVASELVPMTIAPTPISAAFRPIAAEQGQTLDVSCTLEISGDVPDRLTATLEGLPNRVTAQPVTLSGKQAICNFQLKFANDAPLGTFTSLQCRLEGELHGQAVSYVVAYETPLQIAEVGKLVRGDSGEILSPLEALKQKKSRP